MFDVFRRAVLATVLASVPAWALAQTAAPQERLTDAERAAVRALIAKAPKDGTRRFYDLSDPSEELALRAVLRLNGRTPQSRPYQFKMIEERKAEQRRERARRGRVALALPKGARMGTAAAPVPQDIDQVINIGTNDWKSISSAVVSSYYGGTIWSQAAVNVFDAGGASIASGIAEEYGGGKLLVVQSDDGANTGGQDVTTLGTFFYIDKSSGKKYGPLYASITGGYYPKQIIDTKPQITTTNKNVVICLNRANPDPKNPTKCDYGPTDPNVPNDKVKVKVPFAGSIQYFDKIEVDPVTKKPPQGTYTVSLYLIGQTSGGGCSGQEIGDTFMGNPNTVVNDNTISWNMEYADFGHVCYQNNESYTLTFSMMLTFNKVPIWATITNDPTTKPTVSTLKIPGLQIQYGCVLEGAEVLMADGSKRPIEKVKIGDQVASRKGPLYVNSTTVGWDFDFVEIAHNAEGKVTVTLDHPVVTQRGLVKASELKRDDVVYASGSDQPAKVTAIKLRHERKARRVYNLMLTATDGPPPSNVADANFYAGNVLIGDAEGQRQLMQQPADTAAVRARMPAAMRADYDNWVKEQAARK